MVMTMSTPESQKTEAPKPEGPAIPDFRDDERARTRYATMLESRKKTFAREHESSVRNNAWAKRDDLREELDKAGEEWERRKEAEHAEHLVAEEVDRMMARLRVAEVTPTIVAFQTLLEQIGAGELEKVRHKYGPLTGQQEEALAVLTRGIINKIAHGPITELRSQAGQPESARLVAILKRVFNLQD